MAYLKLTRGWITLASFLAASLLLIAFPSIDLAISSLFFEGGFHLRNHWWPAAVQAVIPYFLTLSMAAIVGIYLYNRRTRRSICGIDGRKVLYLLAVLVIGAGLIVNAAFKDHLGRARPREVAEFGGTARFSPAFVLSRECKTNCSFPSGDAAAAFFALALARVLSRRRAVMAIGALTGILVSLSRVAVGAHFFSDVVMSFFVMWILLDVLHHYLFESPALRSKRLATAGDRPAVEFP